MALGMTAVIATGGIDLSVGSIMGLVAVASGLTLEAGYPGWLAVLVGLFAGFLVGLDQWIDYCIFGFVSVRHDAGHARYSAFMRGGAVRQSHAL